MSNEEGKMTSLKVKKLKGLKVKTQSVFLSTFFMPFQLFTFLTFFVVFQPFNTARATENKWIAFEAKEGENWQED